MEKQTYLQSKPIIVGLCNQFEKAGSVVTVKRCPSSKRAKARVNVKGADIVLSSGQSKPLIERDSF